MPYKRRSEPGSSYSELRAADGSRIGKRARSRPVGRIQPNRFTDLKACIDYYTKAGKFAELIEILYQKARGGTQKCVKCGGNVQCTRCKTSAPNINKSESGAAVFLIEQGVGKAVQKTEHSATLTILTAEDAMRLLEQARQIEADWIAKADSELLRLELKGKADNEEADTATDGIITDDNLVDTTTDCVVIEGKDEYARVS